jgi:hypothetical protein
VYTKTAAGSVRTFFRDDDIAPDPGFNFGRYSSWVASVKIRVSQPMVSANGHFAGSGLALSDWTDFTINSDLGFDAARVAIVEQMAPGKCPVIQSL